MSEATKRVAEVLLRQYASQYDAGHLTWRDCEKDAQECVDAVVGLLRERAALVPPPSDDEPYSLGFTSAIEVLAPSPEGAVEGQPT